MDKLDDITIAKLVLGHPLPKGILPHHKQFSLSQDPKIKERAEQILFWAVAQLARGSLRDLEWRRLIHYWARSRLGGSRRKRGRPHARDKEWHVCFAYIEKIEKNPKHKADSIIKELEDEFGLKARRIRDIIAKVER